MTIIVNGSNTPTAGAVGYGDGTNLAFTSAGTTGQFLSSNGSSAPSWVGAPASAMTLISTLTASNSSSLQWTGLSGYKSYQLIFRNATSDQSTSTALVFQVGEGATPTWISSSYNGMYNYSSQQGITTTSGADVSRNGFFLDTAGYFYGGNYVFYDITATTSPLVIQGLGYLIAGNTTEQGYTMITQLPFTGNVKTAIRAIPLTGNIVSGTFSLYGISS